MRLIWDAERQAGAAFFLHIRTPLGLDRALAPVPFASLDDAYRDVCAAIPDAAADVLRIGIDPMQCIYLICDLDEVVQLEVPFSDLVRGPSRRRVVSEGPAGLSQQDDALLARSAALRTAAGLARARSCAVIARSRDLIAMIDHCRPGPRPAA